MPLITFRAGGGSAELKVELKTLCSWQFFYNTHLISDSSQQPNGKPALDLGDPASNVGGVGIAFALENPSTTPQPYNITLTWLQNGQPVRSVTLTDQDANAQKTPPKDGDIVPIQAVYQVLAI